MEADTPRLEYVELVQQGNKSELLGLLLQLCIADNCTGTASVQNEQQEAEEMEANRQFNETIAYLSVSVFLIHTCPVQTSRLGARMAQIRVPLSSVSGEIITNNNNNNNL